MIKHRGQKLKSFSAKGSSETSGMEEKADAWLIKLSSQVSRACDNFWTKTDERRSVNANFYKSNPYTRQ
jgi:hypothetical protein